MAIISRAELLAALSEGSVWNTGVTFERTNPVPIEKYSIFGSLTAAETYASSNAVAYPGQPIAVIESDNTVKLFIIQTDGSLQPVGYDMNLADFVDALSIEVVDSRLQIKGFKDAKKGCIPQKDPSGNGIIWVEISSLINDTNTVTTGDGVSIVTANSAGDTKIVSIAGFDTAANSDSEKNSVPVKDADGNLTWISVYSSVQTDAKITAAIANIVHFEVKVVSDVSEVTTENILYLIKDDSATGADKYNEYIFIKNDDGSGEALKIGDTSIDLSNYVTTIALEEALKAYAKLADFTSLKNRVDSIENTTIPGINDKISAIEKYIGSVDDENTESLDERIDDLESSVNNDILGSGETSHASKIAKLEQTVSAADTGLVDKVGSIEESISGINNKISNIEGTYATAEQLRVAKEEINKNLADNYYTSEQTDNVASDAAEAAKNAANSYTDGKFETVIGTVTDAPADTVSDTKTVYSNINKIKADLQKSISDVSDDVREVADDLSEHTGDTTVHITSDERTKWNNAQENVIEDIVSETFTITKTEKTVSINLDWNTF